MLETMNPLGDSLATRTISAFPLSIGTSLAFESLFSPRLDPYDPQRVLPPHIDVSQYPEVWINIETLFRNMVGAITKDAFNKTDETDFVSALEQEIEVIQSLFSNEGNNLSKPRFYNCTYKTVKNRTHSAIKFRGDKTDYQKLFSMKQEKTFNILLKHTDEILTFDSELKPTVKYNTLILTHIPWDLISYRQFNSLDLLESHTGKLKPRHLWFTKYYPVGDKNLSVLPFNRKFLLIFGDKVMIQPFDYKLRTQLIDIATRRHWTAMTTSSKIELDLSLEIKDPLTLDFLSRL